MHDRDETGLQATGFDRRTLLKRGAVVGGAAVWATPVVQSLARPAFAAGSPGCPEVYRFKYEVDDQGGGSFDNGDPHGTAGDCLPDGYSDADPLPTNDGSIPGHDGGVVITLAEDGESAEIALPPGCVLLDGDAKAGGQGNNTFQCADAQPVPGREGVYTVALDDKEISFIAGVICCS